MDRRQRKSREAIFKAFTALLSQKEFHQITVGQIIEAADVGRATFYAHFETKEYLLKAFCEELFCHLFDAQNNTGHDHRHIFDCNSEEPVFLHLFAHLKRNDNYILSLLSSGNNALFLSYFRTNLESLVESNLSLFAHKKNENIPDDFWKDHILSTFMSTLKWWVDHGMQEAPEKITEYFYCAV